MMRADRAVSLARAQARPTEEVPMSTLIMISRAFIAAVGAMALLLAGGNLATGGASITDPVMPFGLLFGLLTIGAAVWTTASQPWRAAIVWLGILAIVAAFVMFVVSFGDAAIRDVLIYFGIPATIVLVATAFVAVARWRAGALGSAPTG
jgi:hypothetical protein